MPAPAPIVLAATLAALGVHATTALVMLALDARNRPVRWYVAFLAVMTAWLATTAARLLGAEVPAWWTGALAHALPLALLLFGLVVARDPAGRTLALVGAGAAALAPLTLVASRWHVPAVDAAYQVVMWGAAAAAIVGGALRQRSAEPAARRRLRYALGALPLLIAALTFRDGGALAAPVLSSLGQGLALFGAIRLQLYGLAERAVRTGALARDAAELERLALLGEVGATVAHEVRNPLTGIRSLAQRLASDEPIDAPRRARFAALIVSEVDRLDRFVGGMLALARGDAKPADGAGSDGAPADGAATDGAATDVAALFDDLRVLVAARAARRGVRLATRGAGRVAAPRGPLAQVLLNLLLNAIDHSPDDGVVTLEARPADGGLALVVRDQGPGLSDAARATMFQPFADGARGTGLGLAVVRRIAESHGWRVEAGAAPGPGATFTLALPAA